MGKVKNKQSDREVAIQVQETTLDQDRSSTNPVNKLQVQEPVATLQTDATSGLFFRKLFQQLFYSHLVLIAALIVFLTIRGFLAASNGHHFYPRKWYPPILASTATAGLVAFIFQWFTKCNPSRALKLAFWISPLLTCGAGVLLISIGSAGGLAVGALVLFFALVQSLYACWAGHRFEYAGNVLSVSLASPPRKTTLLVVLSLVTGILYSTFLVSGIGGASATRTGLDVVFIIVLLLSLAWTMQVIKNTVQTSISQVKFMHHACGTDHFDALQVFCNTKKNSMGSVCIGSALVPVLGVIRGSARAMALIAGDTDEFLFSCVNCYSGIASTLITYGNRWGFVQVGVYQKGFLQASMDTWEMFRRVGIESLIDSDLTGTFCFLCGVTGGAISTLAGGSWALTMHKSYATEVSIYAFLIGYFMSRVAMAWPQACVLAYYVAYAENPESLRFDSTIPVRIEQLQRYQARANES